MESVNLFNSELSSLYDVKPPISKGKMTAITKAALKAVKLYKHVVQSVEKFIQKCKPEYKIPGLYVIDSIIRQSRHQFGTDKDIFAGRFSRNLQSTFVHLYRCPDEDKSKVIRVLNLWQRNRIFLPEAIQPLFDLADPNNPIWETVQVQQQLGSQDAYGSGNDMSSQPSLSNMNQSNDQHPIHFKKELLDYDYDEEDDTGGGDGIMTSGVPHPAPPPPQLSQAQVAVSTHNEISQSALSGFDALGTILTNPEVLRQLQTLQEQMAAAAQQQQQGYLTPEQERQRKLAELNKQEAAFDQRLAQTVARLPFAVECDLPFVDSAENRRSPKPEINSSGMGGASLQNVDQNSNHQHNPGLLLPPPFFHQLNAEHLQQMLPVSNTAEQQHMNMLTNPPPIANPFGIPLNFPMQTAPPPLHYHHPQPPALPQQNPSQFNPQQLQQLRDVGNTAGFPVHFKPDQPPPFEHVNFNDDSGRDDHRERDRRDRGLRSGERSRIRSRSRSGSESQRRRSRSSSRTRSRKRHLRSRSRSRERKEDKEREKERQRKGLPSIKKEHLSICSTTLWVGHLSKLVSQEEISDTFGSYGDVVSIDLILPRGCAFVVMNRRQDACRALDRLRNSKLQSKAITLAWAPGKGVKGRDWKDYWEVDAGVSYIPWSKLKLDTNLEEFEDGGGIDEDSLPDFLKKQYKTITAKEDRKEEKEATKPSNSDVKEDTNLFATNHSSTASTSIPTLSVPDSDKIKSGDIDARPPSELIVTTQIPTISHPGPPVLAPPFGIPPPAGMMGVPSLAMNMMIPPPMLGTPMCLPPQFQGLNSLPNMNLPMMGMMPSNMGPRMQQDLSSMKNLSAGQGLLGEMPMPQHSLNVQMKNANNALEFADRMNEENRKRRPDDRRENREKKRSRFDDVDDRNSPTHDIIERHSPTNFERLKDGPPLFERLKNMAGGYGFSGQGNNEKLTNSLLGAPIGPPQHAVIGSRGTLDPRIPDSRGFSSPLLTRGGHPIQFGGQRPPFPIDRQPGPGPRPWFDGAQNPFMHQNSQNPFAGNPFIQQGGTNPNENPFEMGGPPRGGSGDRAGRGQFFGGPEPPNHFTQRGGGSGRGWPRGDGPPQSNNWRGPGLNGPRGRGGPGPNLGRGAPSWRGRNQDEDLGLRDIDRDRESNRGFRGGRGSRDMRDRGNEFDRGGDRRRDWDRGTGRGRNDRDGRGPPNRDRERERDRDFRDRGRDRDIGSSRDSRKRSVEDNNCTPRNEAEKKGHEEENWESDVVQTLTITAKPIVKNEKNLPEIPVKENTNANSNDSVNKIKPVSHDNNNIRVNAAVTNEKSTQRFVQDLHPSNTYSIEIKPEPEPQFLEDKRGDREEPLPPPNNNYGDFEQDEHKVFEGVISIPCSELTLTDCPDAYSKVIEKAEPQPLMDKMPESHNAVPLPLTETSCINDNVGSELRQENLGPGTESTFEQNNFNNSEDDMKALNVN